MVVVIVIGQFVAFRDRRLIIPAESLTIDGSVSLP
jgi:hypothetical protein